MEKEYKVVPISQVIEDPNQPRQFFDAAELARLSKSIKKMGVKNPIVVERKKDGMYHIVDGARRYRASKLAGEKNIPVFVGDVLTDVDRIVQQFHLQELHAGWTLTEKALAVRDLAESLSMTPSEVGEMLNLPPRTIRDFVTFLSLAASKEFVASEVPMRSATAIKTLTNTVKTEYLRQLGEDFEDEKAFQVAIINRIKTGDIVKTTDFSKIRDAIIKDVRCVDDILAQKKSTEKIFLESEAGDIRAVRMFSNSLRHMEISAGKLSRNSNGLALLDGNTSMKAGIKRVVKFLQTIADHIE